MILAYVDSFEDAVAIATAAAYYAGACHAKQTRRDGTTPYIEHVRDVAVRVYRKTKAADATAVAWLHDVLEDCPEVTEQTLLARGFSERVVEAVVALTKRSGEPYEEYLHRVAQNPIARTVKVQDILSNLSDDPTPQQVRRYVNALAYLTSDNLS